MEVTTMAILHVEIACYFSNDILAFSVFLGVQASNGESITYPSQVPLHV